MSSISCSKFPLPPKRSFFYIFNHFIVFYVESPSPNFRSNCPIQIMKNSKFLFYQKNFEKPSETFTIYHDLFIMMCDGLKSYRVISYVDLVSFKI